MLDSHLDNMHHENGRAFGPLWLQHIADTIEVKRTKGDLLLSWLLRAVAVAVVGAGVLAGAHWLGQHPVVANPAQTPLIAFAGFAILGLMAFVVALYRNKPALEEF